MNPAIFRAYDIRGVFGEDFEAEDFYAIAQAYAQVIEPKAVAVGYDVRETSPLLWEQVTDGLTDAGVDVLNIGAISTDMLYFAVVNYRCDGGLVVTASHNPAQYNGIKLVREEAIPVSGDTGIQAIRDRAIALREQGRSSGSRRGVVRSADLFSDYLLHCQSFVDMRKLEGKTLVLNAHCGYAGQVAAALLEDTGIDYEPMLFEPDPTFASVANPENRPDPLQPENQAAVQAAVQGADADFAVAWDADADRCFFFDEGGAFVFGSYITARLGELLVRRSGGGGVIYDPRVRWPVERCVEAAGGTPLVNKCGHSFIKERMRREDALFAGEASAHYYFRRSFYTDNGMVPFLLVLEHLCETGQGMAEWVDELREGHPLSGEINFAFEDFDHVPAALEAVEAKAADLGEHEVEEPIDGLSIRFLDGGQPVWRFNLRASNTEPKVRLNLEALGDETLVREKTEALASIIQDAGGTQDTAFRWA